MIKLNAVSKKYDSRSEESVQIGPVTLEIPAGGITALVGPNGAGKSTLLTMIGRLLGIDSGQISVAGLDVSSTKSADLAKILSILRQENHFVTRLTVRQLVGFGRFPYSKGRLTAADEEIISRYIDFFNLSSLETRYLDELSGGQRQRAYVAMVLCQETDYILLDEPLNNLDIAHSVEMMKHLEQAARQFGRTIIVVLHDINFAARYAQYICAVKDGRIARFGSAAEIMDDATLSEIFNTPIQVIDGPDGPIACYH
ncbi:ATP-binding cassette domain-containing protein [Corynebacterium sp. sy017]|uniref:iron ABC transporter ATP-binding protein n=1 Tax=unclassified Corynebacterium TaxID=2624378 RepID=UPI001184E9F1|nr:MULTISPECIES: ATP-binding cassette domain-containing protein [unclassified Corynebacterium]MBP3089194.1 ATP-binding cassette domain-containing protein [Corynebacterium sp. sy017]QDZ43135.1 ATP-binding cassette domain-containing protein [Corynebacterium sp. sy039]TSD91098.1 ATP-binding cassette domain-containing protein [Corynebacterium sp. SY003]